MPNQDIQNIINKEYEKLSLEDRQIIHNLYHMEESERSSNYDTLHNLVFRITPPTPEQFLDPEYGWLPTNVIASIYPEIKQDFIDIIKNSKTKDKICLYGSSRQGKTFNARLLIIYTMIFIHCLREPSLYYKLSPLTDLCIYLISFKFDKTRQLYLKPMYKILEKSERFVKVKFQDKVKEEQERIGYEKIVYSKATTVGEITLASGLQILLGNDNPNEIIGADIIQSYISEITYFIEEAGATEEQIFQLYSDALERMDATVGNEFLTWCFLDASANYADSLIEKYIIENLQYDKNTYFKWRARWDIRPYRFPVWWKRYQELEKENLSRDDIDRQLLREGLVFRVITGNGNIPVQKVITDKQLENVSASLVAYVPIDSEESFDRNLSKSVKDILGRPTSNENKFIQDTKLIEKIFNLDYLRNIEIMLIADSKSMPEKLLWNQIKDTFFVKNTTKKDKYIIYRAPLEPRYVGLDLAYSLTGDTIGFYLLHKEWCLKKECIIYITDFCFTIGTKDNSINLESPFSLITDLRMEAELPMYGVCCDSFQSQSAIQAMERHQIQAIKQSVDTSLNPYQYMLTCLANETFKAGRNIFLKNNLNSLKIIRKDNGDKVDHEKGKTNNIYNGDWNKSTAGCYAKDLSDAGCQALWGAKNHEYRPMTIFEDENQRFSTDKKIIGMKINDAWDLMYGKRTR